jgi:hypothetical protein
MSDRPLDDFLQDILKEAAQCAASLISSRMPSPSTPSDPQLKDSEDLRQCIDHQMPVPPSSPNGT